MKRLNDYSIRRLMVFALLLMPVRILAQPEPPVISPNAIRGAYYTDQEFTLTCKTPNATIKYKLNDSEEIEYTGPFTLSAGKWSISPVAYLASLFMHGEGVLTYIYEKPQFSLSSGTYEEGTSLTISYQSLGNILGWSGNYITDKLIYSVDGSIFTDYTSAISLSSKTTVEAYILVSEGDETINTPILSATYNVRPILYFYDPTVGTSEKTETVSAIYPSTYTTSVPKLHNPHNLAVTYASSNTSVAEVSSTGEVTIVGVGDAEISAKFEGNDSYAENTAKYTLKVSPKVVTVTDGISAEDKIYDGSGTATLVVSNATISGIVDGDVLTVTATGTFDNANVGAGKTVAISGITLGGEDVSKYKLAESGNQTSTTASITAKEGALSWSNTSFIYDGESHVPTATVSNLIGSDVCTVTVDGAQTTPGTYTATATALSNSNYKLPSAVTMSFTINQKADSISYKNTSENKTYGDNSFINELTKTGDGKVTYTSDKASVAIVKSETGEVTIVGIGTAVITATVTDGTTSTYATKTASYTVSVTAKEAALSWSNTSFTYDGESHVPTATVSNLIGSDVCTVTVDGAQTAPGTYTATAIALSNSNYKLPSASTTSFTINNISAMAVSAEGFEGPYDGKGHVIKVTAPEGATVMYGTTEGIYDQKASPSFVNAGIYYVYFLVTKENEVPYAGFATVHITKAQATLKFEKQAIEVRLNESFSPPKLIVTPNGLPVSYSSNNSLVASVNSKTGEVDHKLMGVAIISAVFMGNENYEKAYDSYVLTVSKAETLKPLEDEQIYTFNNPEDYINPDGTEISLDFTIINRVVHVLPSPDNGYNKEEGCIEIGTSTSQESLDAIEKEILLLISGAKYAPDRLQGFAGLIFAVGPLAEDEEGRVTIESMEEGDCQMLVQYGLSDERMTFQHGERKQDVMVTTSKTHSEHIERLNDGDLQDGWYVICNNEMMSEEEVDRDKDVQRGRKSGINVKVYSVSYHKKSTVNGIETIGPEVDLLKEGCWYDLRGQRISQPLKKGVYIHGNRKVIIR